MRALIQMDEEDPARTLGDALFAEGIESRVDATKEGTYIVWVHDENDLDAANQMLEEFKADPTAARFQRARGVAEQKRKEREKEEKKTRHRTVDMRKRWQAQKGLGRLTLGLIIVSVAVTLIAGFGDNERIMEMLVFWPPYIIHRFEIWRVVTPIFLHLGFIHLLFNMWWLKDFGTVIEHRHSTRMLLAMVLVMGILSNTAQAIIVDPIFGGMSGVVYGLFGYLWIRGKMDPSSGFALRRSTVVILLGWLLFGFTGILPIANMAHLGGLLVGMAWAAIATLIERRR